MAKNKPHKSEKQKTALEERKLQTLQHKKEMLEALRLSLGIVSTAADKVKVTRKTHYDWYKSDPEYAEAVDDINESALDFAESKLHERIEGVTCVKYDKKGEEIIYELPPDVGAICFYLKCKGKDRGYVERQELGITPETSKTLSSFSDAVNKVYGTPKK